MSTDHPVHPATVHFPISFLSLAWGLDLLYGATTKLELPVLVRNFSSSLPSIAAGAHYIQALGIITMLPAVVTGGQQLALMINKGGIYEADGKTMRPKVKTTFSHAALNDLALIASIYSWYIRRDNVGLLPSDVNLLISALMLPGLFYSANLGGTLVYNYGVGLSMGNKGKSS